MRASPRKEVEGRRRLKKRRRLFVESGRGVKKIDIEGVDHGPSDAPSRTWSYGTAHASRRTEKKITTSKSTTVFKCSRVSILFSPLIAFLFHHHHLQPINPPPPQHPRPASHSTKKKPFAKKTCIFFEIISPHSSCLEFFVYCVCLCVCVD